jgi:hypothetical protein
VEVAEQLVESLRAQEGGVLSIDRSGGQNKHLPIAR